MEENAVRSYLEINLEKLQINYLTGAETQLWPGWGSHALMTFSYNKLYYLLEGEYHFEINGKTCTGKPGQMFFIPSRSQHLYHAFDNNNARKMWIHFSAQCGGKDLFETVALKPFIEVDNPKFVEDCFNTIFQDYDARTISGALEQKAAILQLLSYYVDRSNVTFMDIKLDERFEKVIQYINEHLSEEIRLKDLAQLMYLNPNYFIKLFKRNTGLSPIKYILQARINKAKQYLQITDMQINDIAKRCGFTSVYYFDRVFRRNTGFTPTGYRGWALSPLIDDIAKEADLPDTDAEENEI